MIDEWDPASNNNNDNPVRKMKEAVVMELGSGPGLCSLVASHYVHSVVATDYQASVRSRLLPFLRDYAYTYFDMLPYLQILELVRENARLNQINNIQIK